jgi:hypothetical protein
MSYKLIGKPTIESECSDKYETTMFFELLREDGQSGDVWIVAGVPDYLRGSSDAARTQSGYLRVRVYGDCADAWCPESFRPADGNYMQVMADVVLACESAALAAHDTRLYAAE